MTEPEKKKGNPDYTASGVKLVNPPEVKALLDEWLVLKKAYDEAHEVLMKIRAEQSETPEEIRASEAWTLLCNIAESLKQVVTEFGGYQDVEAGQYSLYQTRTQVSYDPEKVKELIPTYADKILIGVDNNVLKGLLRGKLVTQEQVEDCAIRKDSQRFVLEVIANAD